jgi:toxin HigB-1
MRPAEAPRAARMPALSGMTVGVGHRRHDEAGRTPDGLPVVLRKHPDRGGRGAAGCFLLTQLSYTDNIAIVIRSLDNRLAEDLYNDSRDAAVRRLPPALVAAARRKILCLHEADQLRDLRVPPGNRLEALKGDFRGCYSIRINNRWRVVFRWVDGHAHEVGVVGDD